MSSHELNAALARLPRRLPPAYEVELRDFYVNPTPEKWGRLNGVYLIPGGGGSSGPATLWQVLLHLYGPKRVPLKGPPGGVDYDPEWEWCPTSDMIWQAINYAAS